MNDLDSQIFSKISHVSVGDPDLELRGGARSHKTKNPFGGKICINTSFHQLLLYIMKVKSQENQ